MRVEYKHCPWLENSLQTCFTEMLLHVDKGYRVGILRKISDCTVLTATKEGSRCSKKKKKKKTNQGLLKVEVSVDPVLLQQLTW